ncbi:hypothetical protein HAPAU_11360 [Halalkalicoccus paucihalophilus]|uniref:Uncharacterized protein n=1 Tax=Halalkalicoccus paucihalophilus TaxID=1008153 RepID=A0A151AEN1_9EURY|nr:hypothetical protein [Halalkalicoccus paucihalophilus]KYH26045.1 hypothetical protein HAPAU_11360 [Halalkalicoccus paucihalophilus]
MSTERVVETESSLATKVLYLVASVVLGLAALWMTPLLIGPVAGIELVIVFSAVLVVAFLTLLALDSRR